MNSQVLPVRNAWNLFLLICFLLLVLPFPTDSSSYLTFTVAAVASSLEAWKILEDLTYHVDLVLTEVVMPCLSGIGLLQKIMSHKTCKNIPVISEYCLSFL